MSAVELKQRGSSYIEQQLATELPLDSQLVIYSLIHGIPVKCSDFHNRVTIELH